jgi:hypothetical protein
MSEITIRVVGANPSAGTIPDSQFQEIIRTVVRDRMADVRARIATGEYPWGSMSFVVLDRTAPLWKPSDETILFTAWYGPRGHLSLRNAAAKVLESRDHGVEAGVMVHTSPARLADGSFRWGHAACVDGTWVGASGEQEMQDRLQATILAVDLNYRLDSAREAWMKAVGHGDWFEPGNEPGSRYAGVAELGGVTLTERLDEEAPPIEPARPVEERA